MTASALFLFSGFLPLGLWHRSPSIVIGYLMKMRGWRLAESYKWVKDKRPQVNIGRGEANCVTCTCKPGRKQCDRTHAC